ncbi:hypothetical protein, partial [Neisseria sp.]|uniref:hypothetical protein n=1 Tax=Neisseria sp. TaxID=192066 RepID=UPI0026DBEC53
MLIMRLSEKDLRCPNDTEAARFGKAGTQRHFQAAGSLAGRLKSKNTKEKTRACVHTRVSEFGVADGARTHDNRNHNPG